MIKQNSTAFRVESFHVASSCRWRIIVRSAINPIGAFELQRGARVNRHWSVLLLM